MNLVQTLAPCSPHFLSVGSFYFFTYYYYYMEGHAVA
jgi:hypothetical protein